MWYFVCCIFVLVYFNKGFYERIKAGGYGYAAKYSLAWKEQLGGNQWI